jgi:hypothetical protein
MKNYNAISSMRGGAGKWFDQFNLKPCRIIFQGGVRRRWHIVTMSHFPLAYSSLSIVAHRRRHESIHVLPPITAICTKLVVRLLVLVSFVGASNAKTSQHPAKTSPEESKIEIVHWGEE